MGFAQAQTFFIFEGKTMAIERTLSIIKPDAVAKNVIGQIYARFEAAGLKVVAAKMAHLSRGEAEAFYAVHKARPFFNDLVNFMISGPVMTSRVSLSTVAITTTTPSSASTRLSRSTPWPTSPTIPSTNK